MESGGGHMARDESGVGNPSRRVNTPRRRHTRFGARDQASGSRYLRAQTASDSSLNAAAMPSGASQVVHVEVRDPASSTDTADALRAGSSGQPPDPRRPPPLRQVARMVVIALGTLAGFTLVVGPTATPPLVHAGFAAVGPLLGIALIVFSLFGEL